METVVFKKLPQGSAEKNILRGCVEYYDMHGSKRTVNMKPVVDAIETLEAKLKRMESAALALIDFELHTEFEDRCKT